MNIGELWRKLHYLVNRGKLQRELADELEAHRAEMGDRAPSFGSALKLREDTNDAWGFGWFDRLWQDVHYGARILRKSPGFTLTAVAILALGIGLNVTAFGFFDALALRPLNIKDPDSVVRLLRAAPGSSADNASYPAFDFYRRNNVVFSSMWAVSGGELLLDSGAKVRARFISPEFFNEMGGVPLLGRYLGPSDAPGSVVLSHRFWLRQFGGDSAAVGKKIRLNRSTAVVVGVAPSNFISVEPENLDVWIPLADHALYTPGSKIFTDTGMMALRLYGRLAPGISRKAAEDGLRPIVEQYRKEAPQDVWKDEWTPLQPGGYAVALDSHAPPVLLIVGTLLLLVLAAACANLGNLMLARGAMRAREMSIRGAAGASRGRIVRQLLTESLMLAILGAVAAFPLSWVALRLFVVLNDAPDSIDFTPDWRVVLFAITMALTAALLFGLAPALQTSKPSVKRASRIRMVLIAAQVAISCILVILSGLMTRGLERALTLRPGFSFEQSANIYLDLGTAGIRGAAARLFLDGFRARIAQTPGVESVALSLLPPLGNRFSSMGHAIGFLMMHQVDENYFNTMQIPILRGRGGVAKDPNTNIVIGEGVAHKRWPNDSPLGKEFPDRDGTRHWIVVGVAGDAPTVGLGDNDTMEVYRPITDAEMADAIVVVRTANISMALGTLEKVANPVESSIIARVVPMREGFENQMRTGRMAVMSITALGAVALLVAIVGLAGLISYSVTQRTREIGIRMALGARPAEAIRVGFAQLTKPVLIGMLSGLGAAAGLAQTLRFTLFGVSTVDPIAYISAIALFLSLVGLAAIAPLRRATRVDPASALRHD